MIGELEQKLIELRNMLQQLKLKRASEIDRIQMETYILGFQEAAQISAAWLRVNSKDKCKHESIDYSLLTDKHISQHAGYLIEEYLNRKDLEKILCSYPEIDEVFIEMYKKGFQDCKDNFK